MGLLKQFDAWADMLSGHVWGIFGIIPLLICTGIFLMLGLKFMPLMQIGPALKMMWRGRKPREGHEGELTPWRALMASLAATVGTGNIVGVATAIYFGGPGAVFWMWVTGVLGMATKFCEATLAVRYREVASDGSFVGGPMYYIKNGLGDRWKWMAALFAVLGSVACFGIGNMTQANGITANLVKQTGMPEAAIAAMLLVLAALVFLGGVKRIGVVAGSLVPAMCVIYVLGALIILIINIDKVPGVFSLILGSAFTGESAKGGLYGSMVLMAIRYGCARGLFSNEAGLGSSPMAHATAIVKHPVEQGLLGMIDPFLDTIVICTMTALVILVSGQWMNPGITSPAVLTNMAFDSTLPGGAGAWLVTIGLTLFAFSTILGWGLYGERCITYLFGRGASKPFYCVFTLVVPVGALGGLDFVWNFSDLFNGLMAIPNLIALLLLSPVVFKLAREYFSDPKNMTDS
ncbi:MAG: sodium:alanine symporter family protein [Deltaproteobacteria bacterium]|nr:sodium:alanine symporter family protein [Deltaproteobacteria bacterium]